ncbi:hypothetical protein DTL42_00070 [Bremerella cremea]|uniref:Uncharacterized protein n=1 Tax=Bremerella cremea TaxID=1031537 RepID=A0A368KZ63_9BACT|nr:hypothetical protein [Bremerella cremea]RCS56159.1 hypothetical protein DTL42_00070 [Bremerella cremea]
MTHYSGSGGTEGGNMVLYWPENLPENAETLLEEDPVTFLDKMAEEGRIIWFLNDGDGQFTVSVYVDEIPPAPLKDFLGEEENYSDVHVKGPTFFGGLECVGEQEPQLSDEYEGLFTPMAIPEGTYHGTVYRTFIPPAFTRRWLIERLGKRRYRILHWQQLLSKASFLGIVACLFAFFFLQLPVWLLLVAIVAGSFVAAVLLARSEACREAIVAIDEFTQLYPEFVVVLSSTDGAESSDPEASQLAMPVGST